MQLPRRKPSHKAPWNRCDDCGRFISFDDIAKGVAVRRFVTPDSHYSKEEYETLCSMHVDREC